MQPADLDLGLEVQRVLNRRIRPLLNVDAGDIEIRSVKDGHVTLGLLGSCGRCLFRASCALYTVIETLEERFSDRDASFSVDGVRVPRSVRR